EVALTWTRPSATSPDITPTWRDFGENGPVQWWISKFLVFRDWLLFVFLVFVGGCGVLIHDGRRYQRIVRKLEVLGGRISRVISSNMETNYQGFEAWAVGKIMAIEKPNREAMYRVLRSLWLTKYEVNFVALNEEVIMVKFGYVEDRNRILNMMPWLFDNCLFAMLPFVKDKELETNEFNFSSFWLRIYNIPLEYMERQIAMDVGKAIGELVAIDWKDRNGGWTEVMRLLKVKINVSNLLRRVVRLVGRNGVEMVCAIKFERLPAFCYYCGIIGHTT
ncbi:hypothetical protein Golax_022563, partial [Gossypium laxum]|nr:hypothetical protein [Gossypium laxum]